MELSYEHLFVFNYTYIICMKSVKYRICILRGWKPVNILECFCDTTLTEHVLFVVIAFKILSITASKRQFLHLCTDFFKQNIVK